MDAVHELDFMEIDEQANTAIRRIRRIHHDGAANENERLARNIG